MRKLPMHVSSIKNKAFTYVGFPLLYGLIVCALTALMARIPVVLHIEHAVYDLWHTYGVIQERTDSRAKDFEQEFRKIMLINLDESFIDKESDRVNQQMLGALLSKIGQNNQTATIFLNYHLSHENSQTRQLLEVIEKLDNPLVLPLDVSYEEVPLGTHVTEAQVLSQDTLLFSPKYSGYFNPISLVGDADARYCKLRFDDMSHVSSTYALLEATQEDAEDVIRSIGDTFFEINYLIGEVKSETPPKSSLRNNLAPLQVYPASQILNTPDLDLGQFSANKDVIFVGSFIPYKNKFEQALHLYPTPISDSLPAMYIAVNAYINLKTLSFLRKSAWWEVLLLNFFIGLIGMYFYRHSKPDHPRKMVFDVGEVFLYICCFLIITGVGFLFFYKLYPFVLTSLFLVRFPIIYEWFIKQITPTP